MRDCDVAFMVTNCNEAPLGSPNPDNYFFELSTIYKKPIYVFDVASNSWLTLSVQYPDKVIKKLDNIFQYEKIACHINNDYIKLAWPTIKRRFRKLTISK
jgi:hypothetical protein